MWIVRLALRRPYTFVVAALLLLLLTPFILLRTPTDILPSINIPVVSILWNYTGRSAQDVERTTVQLRGQQLVAAVALVKSLGGGWQDPAAAQSSRAVNH